MRSRIKGSVYMEFITNSPAETEKIGQALGKIIKPGTVIAYRGDLGAGKTAFTRGLAQGLGSTELVTSLRLADFTRSESSYR